MTTQAERMHAIENAGYQEIELRDRWSRGFLEKDPRPQKHAPPRWMWIAAIVLGLTLAVAAFIFANWFTSWDILPILGITAGGLLAPIMVVLTMGETSQQYDARCRQSLHEVDLPGTAYLFFKGEISPEAQDAKLRAETSKLFNMSIQVMAPSQAFHKATSGPYIIVGTVEIVDTLRKQDIFCIYEEVAAAPG